MAITKLSLHGAGLHVQKVLHSSKHWVVGGSVSVLGGCEMDQFMVVWTRLTAENSMIHVLYLALNMLMEELRILINLRGFATANADSQ